MKICPICRTSFGDEHAFCPEDGVKLEPAPASRRSLGGEGLVGQVVGGRYKIEAFIGGGGFGVVYKVRDQRLDDVEALKIVKSDMLSPDEAKEVIARFNREAKLLRRLGKKSQHIVGVTNLGEDQDLGLFFTMEYVAGGDLKSALLKNGGPFPLERTLRIGRQICSALKAAHNFQDDEAGYPNGVVHRDLKLENVMLLKRAGQDHAKVLDFGIAKILGGKTVAMDSSGGGPGTPGYSPPEQITRPKDIDHRSDLFPLGVILFRLATFHEPWFGKSLVDESADSGESWMAVVDRTLRERPISPRELNPQLPKAFEKLVLKLLEKEQSKRYQTAEEVDQALEELQKVGGGDPGVVHVTSEPPGARFVLKKGLRTVARGKTPWTGSTLSPGAYFVQLVDKRYEPVKLEAQVVSGGEATVALPTSAREGASTAWLKKLVIPAVGVAVVAVGALTVPRLLEGPAELQWTELEGLARQGRVTGVALSGASLEGGSNDPEMERFRVALAGVGLQELGTRLEAWNLPLDPEGGSSSVRVEGPAGGRPRQVAIEGHAACSPCAPQAEVSLRPGWHRLEWADDGPETGEVTLTDLGGRFAAERISVGAQGGDAGRFFVANDLELQLGVPALAGAQPDAPCAATVQELREAHQAAQTGDDDQRFRALQGVERRLLQERNAACADDPGLDEVQQSVGEGYRSLAMAAQAGDDRASGGRFADACLRLIPGDSQCTAASAWANTTSPAPGTEQPSRPADPPAVVCATPGLVEVTRLEFLDASESIRVEWRVAFTGPELSVAVELPVTVAGREVGRLRATGRSASAAAGVSGQETVTLADLGIDRRSDATLGVRAVATVQPTTGCGASGPIESSGRELVIPGTVVPRTVDALRVGGLQFSEEDGRWLVAPVEVALSGPVGSTWCAVVSYGLRSGDQEYAMGVAAQDIAQQTEQVGGTVALRLSIARGDLPGELPNSARNAQVTATALIYGMACSDVVARGAQPESRAASPAMCMEKYPATDWQPCR